MRREAARLAFAVQMLTRLPVPPLRSLEPDAAARYYPLAGELVGLVAAGVFLLAARVFGAGAPAALLAIGAGALATGGFHEDGLADTFDALGGRNREQRLAIMKDSRVGSYGVLALGLVTGLRVAALATLPPLAGAAALLFAHGGARAAAVPLMAALPYAGDPANAKLASQAGGVSWGEAAVALVLGLWPALLVGPGAAAIGVALAALSTLVLARQARRSFGGFTGDVLGAAEQLAEAALLLGGAAYASGAHSGGW